MAWYLVVWMETLLVESTVAWMALRRAVLKVEQKVEPMVDSLDVLKEVSLAERRADYWAAWKVLMKMVVYSVAQRVSYLAVMWAG